MSAGLGYKLFVTGNVLTAADVDGYLMQGVLVFASSAARAAAITSPQEGQYSYLKDTNSTEYYDGAAWIAAPIGDITGVTAGTGISGGGTSGTVTITNSMATEITAKGDLIAGTGSATFDNLPVGTNGQVLQADSTASTGLKWATPAAGGTWTQVGTGALSGASVTISGLSGKALMLSIENWKSSSISYLGLQLNGDTTNAYVPTSMDLAALSSQLIMSGSKATTDGGYGSIFMPNAGIATQTKMVINGNYGGIWANSATISSIKIYPSAGSFNTGSYYIWSQS